MSWDRIPRVDLPRSWFHDSGRTPHGEVACEHDPRSLCDKRRTRRADDAPRSKRAAEGERARTARAMVACAAPRFLPSSPPHPSPLATIRRSARTEHFEGQTPGAVATPRQGASDRTDRHRKHHAEPDTIHPQLDCTHVRPAAAGRAVTTRPVARVRQVATDEHIRERVVDAPVSSATTRALAPRCPKRAPDIARLEASRRVR